ncbi:hypothetical protein KAJ27_20415 [bacterium]|nr:hypothetical protein [bacterium]
MKYLSKEIIMQSIAPNKWDFGNKILYKMCMEHPQHIDQSEIIGKIWLIGRSYAAAIERRKINFVNENAGDDFYINKVAPAVAKSEIDNWIKSFDINEISAVDNLGKILEVHQKLTKLFKDITGMEKRSLASKYLHFHRPNLFFIYDSRADYAVSELSDITGRVGRNKYIADNVYRKFFEKCLLIQAYVKKTYSVKMTPRQLDNLLLGL